MQRENKTLEFNMAGIHVYNKKDETHIGENNYDITRPSILSNPYSHLPENKTRALYRTSTREEAIKKYSKYFDTMYSGNVEFKKMVDEIYEKYCKGEDVYLGCVCKPLPCHGDVIVQKLTNRLVKEKFLKNRVKKSV